MNGLFLKETIHQWLQPCEPKGQYRQSSKAPQKESVRPEVGQNVQEVSTAFPKQAVGASAQPRNPRGKIGLDVLWINRNAFQAPSVIGFHQQPQQSAVDGQSY